MKLEQLQEIAEQMLEDYDLDHGNAEVWIKDEYMTIEAPRNTTLQVSFYNIENVVKNLANEEEARKYIKEKMIERINDFDVDETFRELWSRESSIEPLDFMEMLNEDYDFFTEIKDELR